MANIIGIMDPDSDRRRRFIDSVKPRLAPFSWLQTAEIDKGNLTIAWAAIPSAPVSRTQYPDGMSSFVLGDVQANWEEHCTNSEYILQLVRNRGPAAVAGQYGFYAACVWKPDEITLGADLLGLFPLYYYAAPQFMLFSTSYPLFKKFPGFSAEINPPGLAGILLTTHITGNRTLFKNVRRLPAGHALRWRQGRGGDEMPAGFLKASLDHFGDTYHEHLDRFDELLHKAVSKKARYHQTLLLSGGLDSRILAGYLDEMPIANPAIISIGDRSDNEVRFAKKVAGKIGWPQTRLKVNLALFPEFARKAVELEQISNGFADLAFFESVGGLFGISPYITTGFAGDLVIGGSHIRAGYDGAQRQYTYEAKFRFINKYGVSPGQIRELVRPEILGDGLEAAMEDLKSFYDGIEGLPFQRTCIFDYYHRLRFHTAASIVWRLSFGIWPILPYMDSEVIEAALAMPAASMLDRRAQIDLLCRRFSSLAALPLERMTLDTSPLLLSTYGRWVARLKERTGFYYKKRTAMRLLGMLNYETRSYFKTFDINNAGWSAVREDAEQYRVRAERIFDSQALKQLLPPPNIPIDVPVVTVDSSRSKLLLAFMLWAGENL